MVKVKVIVGRMDNNKTVDVEEDSTILEAMQVGGYHPASNETVKDIDNREFSCDDKITPNKGYFLTHKVKSGLY